MTRAFLLSAWAAGSLVLAACDSTGSRTDGIHITVNAVPTGAAYVDGGDPHTVTFRRDDGMRIDLQLGLLKLAPVELARCDDLRAQLHRWLAPLNPLGSAWAHAEHDHDAPEAAVSVVNAPRTDLGRFTALPGSYCGVVVELVVEGEAAHGHATAITAKHGGALDETLDGAAINVAPCYYPATVGVSEAEFGKITAHHCVQVKAQHITRRWTLPFATPVTLDAEQRQLDLQLNVDYEMWFDGLDMDALVTDMAQHQRLADNVIHSLSVND